MKRRIENIVLTLALLLIILAVFIRMRAYRFADEMFDSAAADVQFEAEKMYNAHFQENGSSPERPKDSDGNEIPAFSKAAGVLNDVFPAKKRLIYLSGYAARTLGLREIYKDNGGVLLNNGYIAGVYPFTATDFELSQIVSFQQFLKDNNVQLLYVNEPAKYTNDQFIEEDLGLNTFINNNTDRFLQGLADNGINYIDLRDQIKENNSFSYFYRTDHHWTVPAGKMAAQTIAGELNRHYGYSIDLSIYDDDKYKYIYYDDAWLGEQGKKLGLSYVGLDDFIEVYPNYPTRFSLINGQKKEIGSFEDVLINKTVYLPENNKNPYDAKSWHYSYRGNSGKIINEDDKSQKKILVLGDSYDVVTNCFLALGVSEVQGVVMRSYKGSIRDYIKENEYDTVVIAYASFMIGAHDNTNSANYKMFDFS